MRILVTGGAGQLARSVARRGDGVEVRAPLRAEIDVAGAGASQAIAAVAPDVVVNAAAMTDVDGCERDPDAAYRINALGARNVAVGAAACGAVLVQMSTDYVFSGEVGRPYWEFDRPDPVSVYGASKLAGEELVRAVHQRAFVVRTSWLYGLGGNNFVTRILALAAERRRLEVVDSEVGSPTFCDDLADALLKLVRTTAYGTYHLVNEGAVSRAEFARAILDRAGRTRVAVDPSESYPRAARPPTFAPLRNFAGAQLGVRLPSWTDALDRYFARSTGGAGS